MRILVETDLMLIVMEEYIQDISKSYLKHCKQTTRLQRGPTI